MDINVTQRNKLLHSSFLVILFLVIAHVFNIFFEAAFIPESSVWCSKDSNQTKTCRFRNICYDHRMKTFLFFLAKSSVIKGFIRYQELQKIQLSSVLEHNQFFASLSVIDAENYMLSEKLKIVTRILLLSRFKPNNIMHIFHDDLFPAFLTLESICAGDMECIQSYDLMFHDNLPRGPFFSLYKLFSKNSPIVQAELSSDLNDITCFKEVLTGLDLSGIFYQYGFKRPHGPIQSTELTQADISRFTSFIKSKLKIKEENTNSDIILFSRERSRKILNTLQIKEMVENMYKKLNKKVGVKLIKLDLFSHDLTGLIKAVSESDGLIGMHGAEMILSLFMKPGSYVCELFPFGIVPDVVSFVKPVSQLEGSNFMYLSWRNPFKNYSVAHPDAHPLIGGIAHLDAKTQQMIKETIEVPPVKCCNDPLFLYHMYQDTWVTKGFADFLYESLSKSFTQSEQINIRKKWFYPYKVFNGTCTFSFERKLLHVKWKPPFNVLNTDGLQYSLHVRDKKGLFSRDISTQKTDLQVEIPVTEKSGFEVWISATYIKNLSTGPDLYLNCLLL